MLPCRPDRGERGLRWLARGALRAGKLRQERIEQDGLTVVRWTWPEAYQRPDTLAYRVGTMLRRRGWHPPAAWLAEW